MLGVIQVLKVALHCIRSISIYYVIYCVQMYCITPANIFACIGSIRRPHQSLCVPAGVLPCDMGTFKVTPTVPDPKIGVEVNGQKPGSSTPLNLGSTIIVIDVTSADGSNTEVTLDLTHLLINTVIHHVTWGPFQ